MTSRWMAAGLILCASLVRTAAATPIFQLSAMNSVQEFVITDTGFADVATVSNLAVTFSFGVVNPLGEGTYDGTLSFNAQTNTTVTTNNGFYDQSNWATTSTATVTCTNCPAPYNNKVIFSFAFGPDATSALGPNGPGTAGTIQDSQPPVTDVSFSSPVVNFAGIKNEGVTILLSNAASAWSIGSGGYIASNTATETMLFTGTPEPGTFILIGCALAGVGLIGRKRFSQGSPK